MRKIFDWCMLKARRIAGALSGFLPKQEFLLKVRKRVWRAALVLGMLLLMCPVLFSHSMYTSGFSASDFTYTGTYTFEQEAGTSNWKLKFTSSGTFKPKVPITVDIFIVGGGSGGNAGGAGTATNAGGGGGGGLTGTWSNITLPANTDPGYSIVVGAGGTGAATYGGVGGTSSSMMQRPPGATL